MKESFWRYFSRQGIKTQLCSLQMHSPISHCRLFQKAEFKGIWTKRNKELHMPVLFFFIFSRKTEFLWSYKLSWMFFPSSCLLVTITLFISTPLRTPVDIHSASAPLALIKQQLIFLLDCHTGIRFLGSGTHQLRDRSNIWTIISSALQQILVYWAAFSNTEFIVSKRISSLARKWTRKHSFLAC